MSKEKINVLLVEDENLAAIKLLKMLNQIRPNYIVQEQIDSIEDLNTSLKNNDFDLIISDIQLSDGLCFESYVKFNELPPIIFCTAFDQYAIQAFKFSGVDYLLKPIDLRELQIAIEKFEKNKKAKNISTVSKYLLTNNHREYQNSFLSKIGNKLFVIQEKDVHLFYSENKQSFILCNDGREYMIDQALKELVEQIDPSLFFRINRQTIVHRQIISKLKTTSSSRLIIVFNSQSKINYIVSKSNTPEFKQWIKG